jgi:hypothetical protein
MITSVIRIALLCAAVTACGGPRPPTLEEQLDDLAFNRTFGLPGTTPQAGSMKRYPPVPDSLVEVIPRRPRGNLMWQPSGWEWNGKVYVWVKGTYVPARPTAGFERGHWEQDTTEYFRWVPGRWL